MFASLIEFLHDADFLACFVLEIPRSTHWCKMPFGWYKVVFIAKYNDAYVVYVLCQLKLLLLKFLGILSR